MSLKLSLNAFWFAGILLAALLVFSLAAPAASQSDFRVSVSDVSADSFTLTFHNVPTAATTITWAYDPAISGAAISAECPCSRLAIDTAPIFPSVDISDKTYTVTSFNAHGDGSPSLGTAADVSFTTLPKEAQILQAEPTRLEATPSVDSITLEWRKGAADGYQVSIDDGKTWTDVGDEDSHIVHGLRGDTSYTLQVRGYTGTIVHYSPASSITVSTLDPAVNPPIAPRNLRAISATTSSVTIAWTKSPFATSYIVFGGEDDPDTVGIDESWQDVGDVDRHTFSGLTADLIYTFSVEAVNSYGSSVVVPLDAATSGHPAPGAPSNLGATIDSGYYITFTWDAPAASSIIMS